MIADTQDQEKDDPAAEESGVIEYTSGPSAHDGAKIGAPEERESASVYCDDVDVDTLELGASDTLIRFDRLEQQQMLLSSMLNQAASSIILFADQFDMTLIGRDPVVGALNGALNRNPHLSVRTLVKNSSDLVQSQARLAERLRQSMPAVECRLRKPTTGDSPASYLVIDETAYLYLPNPERRNGSGCFNGVGPATRLLDEFEHHWQVAMPDPEMRVLFI